MIVTIRTRGTGGGKKTKRNREMSVNRLDAGEECDWEWRPSERVLGRGECGWEVYVKGCFEMAPWAASGSSSGWCARLVDCSSFIFFLSDSEDFGLSPVSFFKPHRA